MKAYCCSEFYLCAETDTDRLFTKAVRQSSVIRLSYWVSLLVIVFTITGCYPNNWSIRLFYS